MQEQRNAYEIQPEWTVTQLPDMITPRNCHGLWWDSRRGQLEVFGGCGLDDALRDCEQLSRQQDIWRSLPCMQDARSNSAPCEYQELVYLCGIGTQSIEAFNPEACSFRSFQAEQPEMYSACLMIVERGQLVILTENFVTRWTAGENREIMQCTQTQRKGYSLNCSMPPVLDINSGVIYYLYMDNVRSVDLTDHELVERQESFRIIIAA